MVNQQGNTPLGGVSKKIWLIAVAVVLVFICGSGCNCYNKLVGANQEVEQAWAGVQNQYQRRLDLIPNLVETVKGYATHESTTLEKVTAMRTGLSDAYNQANALQGSDVTTEEGFEKYAKAQDNLNKAFNLYINAVHEAYPDLKANQNFQDLQVQLEGTENRIATQRQDYTKAVQNYNNLVLKFPNNIWAGIFGFHKKPQFQADEAAQSAPKVQF